MLLIDKTIGKIIPARFVLFSFVGTLGVVVHLTALHLYHFSFGISFAMSQGLAALTAMTTNFLLNNSITYRDRRLKGVDLLRGLATFYLVCSVGLAANVGVANALFKAEDDWWLAGILGAVVGVVWNYAASSVVTWKNRG